MQMLLFSILQPFVLDVDVDVARVREAVREEMETHWKAQLDKLATEMEARHSAALAAREESLLASRLDSLQRCVVFLLSKWPEFDHVFFADPFHLG